MEQHNLSRDSGRDEGDYGLPGQGGKPGQDKPEMGERTGKDSETYSQPGPGIPDENEGSQPNKR
jgi:hypothetical protein